MIHGLSRFCPAPSGGSVMLASHVSVIVQCNTIASAEASGICSPDGAKRNPGEVEHQQATPSPLYASLHAGYGGRGGSSGAADQLLISRSSTSKTMAPTVEVTMALIHQILPTAGRWRKSHSQVPI